MFKSISWSSYGIFVLIILVVYYATIGLLYYLNEIKQIFSGKSSLLLKLNRSKRFVAKNDIQHQNDRLYKEAMAQDSEENLHALADECMNDIKNTLQHAANNNLVKQEIIYSLQQLINRYPSLKDTSLKSFITNYILIECANYCSIHLDEDEFKGIWANKR
jgi:hypothetical protein